MKWKLRRGAGSGTPARASLAACLAAIAVILVALAVRSVAFADGASGVLGAGGAQVDLSRTGSIAVTSKHDSVAVEGAAFSVYHLADVDASGNISQIDDDFLESGVSFATDDDAVLAQPWSTRALALESYITARSDAGAAIAADAAGVTDASGSVSFAGLAPGVYLLLGATHTLDDGTVLTPMPVVTSIPFADESGNLAYDSAINAKNGLLEDPGEFLQETQNITVVKVWADSNDAAAARPESVGVVLYKDGARYAAAELTEANNWSYTWSGVATGAKWQVAESDVPVNYTHAIEQEATTFTITNTYHAPDAQATDAIPATDTTTLVSTGGEAVATEGAGAGAASATATTETLPQTGQLWWPVSALLAAAIAVFVAGLVIYTRAKHRSKND